MMIDYIKKLKYLNPAVLFHTIKAYRYDRKTYDDKQKQVFFSGMGKKTKKNYSRYQVSRPDQLPLIEEYISNMSISSNDGIIDVGCGKGAMLFFFNNIGFCNVAGLEYDNDLIEICKSNMQKLHITVKIIWGDAKDYCKYENYNFFYLYNPFDGDIMEAFICRLNENLKAKPRMIHIIYSNPICLEMFRSHGYVIERELKKEGNNEDGLIVLTNAEYKGLT